MAASLAAAAVLLIVSWGLFDQVLAQRGFVVFTLDNRGSARRGVAFEAPIHRQMGGPEVDDQMTGIRWLAQQIDEVAAGGSGDSEEQTVRLESDEDLVKVITIHASKGLEYPVVCLPFAHSHRVVEAHKAPVLQLDNGAGERRWSLAFDKDDAAGADRDRLREDLRASLADQPRYIATVETAKHRTFQFLDASVLPATRPSPP